MKTITEEYKKNGEIYERTKTFLEKEVGSRGFGVISFSDRSGQICTLQDSSLATEPAIWLGVSSSGPYIDGPNGLRNENVNQRMHLTQEMVKQLLPYLKEFAKNGEYIANMQIAKPKNKKRK